MAKISRALYKIPLVGGIERIPAIVLGTSVLIILLYSPIYAKICGSIIILLFWGVLAKLNHQDPIFLSVLFHYLHQQKYYLAQALETKKKSRRRRFRP